MQDAVAVNPDNIKASANIKSELVNANQPRRIEGDSRGFGGSLQELLGITLVDFATDRRFIRRKGIGDLKRFS